MADDRDVTTLYLRNVPAQLVREAKARAARQGSTLTMLVIDALAQSLSAGREQPAEREDDLRDSMAWYERNRERLSERFHNEYIAIVDDSVIDHDEDFASLATRVFERVGIRSVFMPRVTRSTQPARVRSPRRRKA
jgi:hypothetical protein